MHIYSINILIFNLDVFYMFRTLGFFFRDTVVYTVVVWYFYMHQYKSQTYPSTY